MGPTAEEAEELAKKCKWGLYFSTNDIADYGLTGYVVYGPNGNYIYFPLCGYYTSELKGGKYESKFFRGNCRFWTSELYTPGSSSNEYKYAYYVGVGGRAREVPKPEVGHTIRYDGLFVRPVQP